MQGYVPVPPLRVGLLGTHYECDMIRCLYGIIAFSAGVCVGGGEGRGDGEETRVLDSKGRFRKGF